MSIIDPIKAFVLRIALKKGIVSAAKLIVSWAIVHGVKVSIPVGTLTIDTTDEAGLIVVMNSGLTMFRNWLKIKWPEKFGWL